MGLPKPSRGPGQLRKAGALRGASQRLANDNRLEAVAWVVGEKEILIAYAFATPARIALSNHPPARIKTQAMQLQGAGETIRSSP